MHSRDADGLVRVLLCAGRAQRRVARVVELRPRVVGHPSVDRDPGPVGEPFHRPDAVEGDAGSPDEGPPGLEPDGWLGEPGRGERSRADADGGGRELGGLRHVLLRAVADAEAASEVDDAGVPAELVAALSRERRQALDRLRLCREVGELRARRGRAAQDVETSREPIGHGCPRLAGGSPNFEP